MSRSPTENNDWFNQAGMKLDELQAIWDAVPHHEKFDAEFTEHMRGILGTMVRGWIENHPDRIALLTRLKKRFGEHL